MKRYFIIAASLFVSTVCIHDACTAASLSTKFADVIMEYVVPGKVYNLRTMRNLPYRVVNSGEGPVDLTVEIGIPQVNQVMADYEPIPDPSWVRAVPDQLHVEAGQTGIVDIVLQVPDDPQYAGRNFQAHIICRTADPPPGQVTGLAFITALQSRLRFTVGGPGPAEVKRQQKKGIFQTLNFTLEPQSQYVPGFLEPGKKINLTEEKGTGVTIINRGTQKLKFSLKSVTPPGEIGPPGGYEKAPDPSWLKIEPEVLKVKGETMKGTKKMILEIPDAPEYRGKRYMFVIQAQFSEKEIPVEVFSLIYVNIAPAANDTNHKADNAN
jgi:hypothetical protein